MLGMSRDEEKKLLLAPREFDSSDLQMVPGGHPADASLQLWLQERLMGFKPLLQRPLGDMHERLRQKRRHLRQLKKKLFLE